MVRMTDGGQLLVAPFTGAWIEIGVWGTIVDVITGSHPSRVRGLKCRGCCRFLSLRFVAPFTGAWIEILATSARIDASMESHPSRVRGLKYSHKPH